MVWRGIRGWFADRFRPKTLGQRGERAACRFLRRLGYQIVAQNQRGKLGELDLVVVDGRTVVFVEVKTRQSDAAGSAAEAVTPQKQARLTRLALGYLKRHGLLEYPARFDVVAVNWPPGSKHPHIQHLPRAFEPQGQAGLFS